MDHPTSAAYQMINHNRPSGLTKKACCAACCGFPPIPSWFPYSDPRKAGVRLKAGTDCGSCIPELQKPVQTVPSLSAAE
jgi:hypothetical protein